MSKVMQRGRRWEIYLLVFFEPGGGGFFILVVFEGGSFFWMGDGMLMRRMIHVDMGLTLFSFRKFFPTTPKKNQVNRMPPDRVSVAAKIAAAVREDEKQISSPYAAHVPKLVSPMDPLPGGGLPKDVGVGTSPMDIRPDGPSPRGRARKGAADSGIVVEEADPMDVSPKYKEVAKITTKVCRGEEYTVRSRSQSPRGKK